MRNKMSGENSDLMSNRRTSIVSLPSPDESLSLAAPGASHRRIEPPVIRKSFPESWIFDSLIVDKEYVRNLLFKIYCSMFGIHLFVKIINNFMLEKYGTLF